MTSLVAIRCSDGVVIGADSAATFGDGVQTSTIEQQTDHKITIIRNRMIVAGTGSVGHGQRFISTVQGLYDSNAFKDKSPLDFARVLSSNGLKDFSSTFVQKLEYAAFVAYVAQKQPVLCELPGGFLTQNQPTAFQPELKLPTDLWFASAGSGQPITDPMLAMLRKVFWPKEPPDVRGGTFMAMWALKHACDLNPGGVKEPVRIATLSKVNGDFVAAMLDDSALAEHHAIVEDAMKHLGQFRDILEGKSQTAVAPPSATG